MTVTRLGMTIRAISGTAARLASISGIFIIGASDVSVKHMYQREQLLRLKQLQDKFSEAYPIFL